MNKQSAFINEESDEKIVKENESGSECGGGKTDSCHMCHCYLEGMKRKIEIE